MTINDFAILKSIISKDDKTKGTIKTNGTTINEMVSVTKMSESKVRRVIDKFKNEGLIEYGLSVKQAKSYILTEKGLKTFIELKGGKVQ